MHDGHEHTLTHPHTGETPDAAETLAVLKFMLEHNVHHTEELQDLAGKLEALGQHKAAHQLLHGIEEYQKGNDRLQKTLDLLQ